MATIAQPKMDVQYTDDPKVVEEARTEDYSLHAVPNTWRSKPLSLMGSWWALASAMFWLVFPVLGALTVGTEDALIGIGLSVIAYSGINWYFSRYAARTGTTVNLFSRTLFGYLGGAIAPILFGLTAIYYATFEGSVVAVALHQYWGGPSLNVWYLIVVCYSVPLIIGGVRMFLDKFNGFLYPFYLVGLIVAVVWAGSKYGFHSHWITQKPAHLAVSGPGWWWAFTFYMGVWVMMMYTWDFARFGRKEDVKTNGLVTFGPVFYTMTLLVNGLAGLFLAFTIPTKGAVSELSGVVGLVGLMGFFGMALVWISQTRINTANFYLASANLENFFARTFKLKLPRAFWAVVVGATVFVLMLTNIFNVVAKANEYQGIVIVAWVAVALTFIVRSPALGLSPATAEWRPGRVPRVNWAGFGGWVAGTAVGIVMLNWAGSFGATWYPVGAFVVSALIYGIGLQLGQREGAAMRARPFDPRHAVDDPWEARVRCHVCEKHYIAQEMDSDPSAGHAAICAGCAQASTTFYHQARLEATGLALERGPGSDAVQPTTA